MSFRMSEMSVRKTSPKVLQLTVVLWVFNVVVETFWLDFIGYLYPIKSGSGQNRRNLSKSQIYSHPLSNRG